MVLPELYRSGRTVQIEYGLTTTPNHMDMGRPMIVRIDHNTQPIEPHYGRHQSIVPQIPKRLGSDSCFDVPGKRRSRK
jgi:hypothetical protein